MRPASVRWLNDEDPFTATTLPWSAKRSLRGSGGALVTRRADGDAGRSLARLRAHDDPDPRLAAERLAHPAYGGLAVDLAPALAAPPADPQHREHGHDGGWHEPEQDLHAPRLFQRRA